jgi:hypothetical protein
LGEHQTKVEESESEETRFVPVLKNFSAQQEKVTHTHELQAIDVLPKKKTRTNQAM